MIRLPSLLVGLLAGVFAAPCFQEPAKPTPAPATTTPAVPPTPPAPHQDPAGKPEAAKEPVGKPAAHALEGVYELRARIIDNKKDALPCHGYVAITRRHLFLCLVAPGTDPDVPLVRTGVRTWRPEGELIAATIELGWFTDKDGGMHAEKPGTPERRRIELVHGGIRIKQDERNWLEFERVE